MGLSFNVIDMLQISPPSWEHRTLSIVPQDLSVFAVLEMQWKY